METQAKTFFAWTDDLRTPFDPVLHARLDLNIVTYSISHSEGEYCRLAVTCQNPGIGMLAPGRQQCCLLSVSVDGGPPVLMFRGIVNSMPTNIWDALVSFEFSAQPADAEDVDDALEAYAKTLLVAPYYDALVSGREYRDPSTALLARAATFYCDPLTLEYSLNDMLDWDSVVDVGPWYERQSLTLRQSKPPLAKAKLNFVAEWQQEARGTVDIADQVNFAGGGGGVWSLTDLDALTDSYDIETPDGKSGWSVSNVEHAGLEAMKTTRKFKTGNAEVQVLQKRSGTTSQGQPIYTNWIDTAYEVAPLAMYRFFATKYEMAYNYSQYRREVLSVELEAEIQDVKAWGWNEETLDDVGLDSLLSDPSPPWQENEDYVVGDKVVHQDKVYVCQLAHNSEYGPFNAVMPKFAAIPLPQRKPEMYRWLRTKRDRALTDSRSATFFTTDRGREFAAYAVMRVRAYLRRRMRNLEMSVGQVRWQDGWEITLKNAVRIESEFFPEGFATGKVVSYTKTWDGATQTFSVSVTLGVACGKGYTTLVDPTPGIGYSTAFSGYAYSDDETVVTPTEDVQWTLNGEKLVQTCNPYKLSDAGYACEYVTFSNTMSDQLAKASSAEFNGRSPLKAVQSNPTKFSIRMKTIDGTDVITRRLKITGTKVQGPRGVNLEWSG